MKKLLSIFTVLCVLTSSAGMTAAAAETDSEAVDTVAAEEVSGESTEETNDETADETADEENSEVIEEEAINTGYAYSADGDTFDFYDYTHKITIAGGTLKDGKDISFYGLNDEGNLAVVYFNVEADEGKGVVATNNEMTYVTYSHGEITEYTREIGTTSLFGFDMGLADSSMAGMMKVFNASLGSFLQAYSAEIGAYSAMSSGASASANIEYVKAFNQHLLLIDDNYITNFSCSPDETFMANEWGIYSGYQVVDGIDYNTFCFFGDNNDVYYYGYAKTDDGIRVLNMKGVVYEIDSRTKYILLNPVDMSRNSDNSSQYITKMASCLMAAQGQSSLNLDTLTIMPYVSFRKGRINYSLYAYTSTAEGCLEYADGKFSGEITDENGKSETLSVQAGCRNYVVTSQTAGVFTVAKNTCGYGSLSNSRPGTGLFSYCGWGYYNYPLWF